MSRPDIIIAAQKTPFPLAADLCHGSTSDHQARFYPRLNVGTPKRARQKLAVLWEVTALDWPY